MALNHKQTAVGLNALTRFQAVAERDPNVATVLATYHVNPAWMWRGDPAEQMAFVMDVLSHLLCDKLKIKDADLNLVSLVEPEPEPEQPVGEPDLSYRFNPAQPPAPPATSAQRHANWGLGWDERK